MKLDEFKKIEEAFRFSDLTGGSDNRQNLMARDKAAISFNLQTFVQDFVEDGMVALDSAVKGGLVDTAIKSNLGGSSNEKINPDEVKPGAGTQPAAGTQPGAGTQPAAGTQPGAVDKDTSMAVGQYKQQQQTTQNINNYVKGTAAELNKITDKNQKIALTKELVNFMADRKDAPEWANALGTVKQVISKSGGDPKFVQAAIQKLQAGQRLDLVPGGTKPANTQAKTQAVPQPVRDRTSSVAQTSPNLRVVKESWKIYYLNQLVEGAGLTWNDLGLTVLQESKTKTFTIAETKYYKLNYIFESIVEAENQGMGIADYLLKYWYPQYMKNVDYSPIMSNINKTLQELENSYNKDKGKAAFTKLAQASYAISSNKGTVPAGAEDISQPKAGAQTNAGAQPGAQTNAGAQPGAQTNAGAQPAPKMNSFQSAEYIKKLMTQLKGTDPDLYKKTFDLVNKEFMQFKDRPPAAAAGEKVSEAKKIINTPKKLK